MAEPIVPYWHLPRQQQVEVAKRRREAADIFLRVMRESFKEVKPSSSEI